jgi:hypothetical protein
MPPAFRNHRVPIAGGTPAPTAAISLALPAAIAAQNCRCSSRPATGGRPGEDIAARPDRSERRFRIFIATSFVKVLRRPLESALAAAIGVVQQRVRFQCKYFPARTSAPKCFSKTVFNG